MVHNCLIESLPLLNGQIFLLREINQPPVVVATLIWVGVILPQPHPSPPCEFSLNKSEMEKPFRFPDFRSVPYKKNCHSSRTSDDIDMNLRPVTKPDKRNKKLSNKIGDKIKRIFFKS